MTRAALLPAGPDPYILAYWLRNYATWADAVDVLNVTVCGQNDSEVRAFIRGRVAAVPHATVRFYDERTDHGLVLDGLIRDSDADLVVLCEDDAFVQRPAIMAECFDRIESGKIDVVGTPRLYGSDELFLRASELWGPMPTGVTGEYGWAFFPAFLFAKRRDLDRVTVDGTGHSPFSAMRWAPGERIKSLDLTVGPDELVADTFGAASFQLRAMGLRCEVVAAFRGDQARPDGPWFHVGSLSDGYGHSFLGTKQSEMDMVGSAKFDSSDWPKRIAWWWHVWNLAFDGPHHARYAAALTAFTYAAGIPRRAIGHAESLINPLVTWAER